MSDDTNRVEQPRLAVEPFIQARRRFLTTALPAIALTAVGSVTLTAAGALSLPFRRLVTVTGVASSKAEFFQDEEVLEVLMRHHIRVELTRADGSRELATGDLAGYDFAFPAGTPSANLIARQYPNARVYQPFLSPLVLGTYRPYADTLVDASIAKRYPYDHASDRLQEPLYYELDTAAFLEATEAGQRWSDLGVERYGITNRNHVLAYTADICGSNSGATYLSLVAFTRNGGEVPQSKADTEHLAERIRPLLAGQGLETSDRMHVYASRQGKRIAPVTVIYEHEYLAYQAAHHKEYDRPDTERVLLYPDSNMMTQPQLFALTPDGERVLDLLRDEPALHRRATALGYRVLSTGDAIHSDQLDTYLNERGIPAPPEESDTRATLPDLPFLEQMVQIVGRCQG